MISCAQADLFSCGMHMSKSISVGPEEIEGAIYFILVRRLSQGYVLLIFPLEDGPIRDIATCYIPLLA